MINYTLTLEQTKNIKKALLTKKWHSLKTWKEKYTYQLFCNNKEEIKAIGLLAKEVLLSDKEYQRYKNTTGLNLATYEKSENLKK